MRRTIKVTLPAILAVCFVSAFTPTSAPAAQWHVAGATFSGTETLTEKIKTSTTVILTSTLPGSKAKVLISCTALSTTAGLIFGNNKGSASKIAFTGCSASEPAGCVTQTEITTKPVTGEITTSGELVLTKITPSTGTEFTSISLSGSACEGRFHVFGVGKALTVAPATEAVEKETIIIISELLFGKEPAGLTGTSVGTLSGAKKGSVWSSKVT